MNLLPSRLPVFNFAPGRLLDSGGTLGKSALVDPIFYELDGRGRQGLAPQGMRASTPLAPSNFKTSNLAALAAATTREKQLESSLDGTPTSWS